MNPANIRLEALTEENFPQARAIRREDVSEDFVDTVDTLMDLTRYGLAHRCLGRTYLVRYGRACVGLLLLGEAIPWETDPEEMRGVPFYRLMGFVLDRRCRGRGLGGYVLEVAIADCYERYGVRPIALGCHRENRRAAAFYRRHGFRETEAVEGNDIYYLRYPGAGGRIGE